MAKPFRYCFHGTFLFSLAVRVLQGGRRAARSMAVAAMAFLVLGATGCATRRVVRVVDADGLPVPNALVVFFERNISPFSTQGAGFADSAGEYAFKAHNLVKVEAFGAATAWGKLNLKDCPAGTVALSSAPYDGFAANHYLSRASHVPEDIRQRLEVFLRRKTQNQAPGPE